VLFCTSEFEVGLIARALHAGADNFLVKPFDGKILRTKIAGLERFTERLNLRDSPFL
jgi:DNA-binding response OmpR family regulator